MRRSLFASGAAAVLFNLPAAFWIAGLLGLVYVYCQARMLHANKGIPAWRHASCIGMIVATSLAEGVGLVCAGALVWPGLASFGVLLAAAARHALAGVAEISRVPAQRRRSRRDIESP